MNQPFSPRRLVLEKLSLRIPLSASGWETPDVSDINEHAAEAVESRWHHRELPADVDGNSVVSPLDALIIINDLNEHGSRTLSSTDDIGHAIDVNNDFASGPIDALLVINQINNAADEGTNSAGDSPAEASSPSSSSIDSSAADTAIDELTSSDATPQASVDANSIDGLDNDRDNDVDAHTGTDVDNDSAVNASDQGSSANSVPDIDTSDATGQETASAASITAQNDANGTHGNEAGAQEAETHVEGVHDDGDADLDGEGAADTDQDSTGDSHDGDTNPTEENNHVADQTTATENASNGIEATAATPTISDITSGSLATTLTGAGSGKVKYEVERRERSFEIEIVAAANTAYPVSIGNVVVGQITTNSRGRGKLKFEAGGEHNRPFPANFPAMAAGVQVHVGSAINGTLSTRLRQNGHDGDDD